MSAPGAVLHGVQGGSGPALPLLFLHAGVADSRAWEAQLTHFARGRRVGAFDARGYGQTTAEPSPFSPTADILAVMEAAGLDRAVLVGNSNGGRHALDFTLAHPERVAGLVLVGPAVGGAPEFTAWPDAVLHVDALGEAAEAAGDLDRLNEIEAWMWLDGPDSPEGRVTGPARTLFLDMNGRALRTPAPPATPPETPAYPRLAEVTCPALVVVGDLDLPHIRQASEHAAQRMPHAALEVMPGVAHLPALEAPEAFNARLDRYLQAL